MTLRQTVDAAIDPSGDLPEGIGRALIGQLVESLFRPEQAGDPERELRRCRTLVRGQQVDAQQIAEAVIVRASGDLDRAAPLESMAVAGLSVAERRGQGADRLVADLRRRRPP